MSKAEVLNPHVSKTTSATTIKLEPRSKNEKNLWSNFFEENRWKKYTYIKSINMSCYIAPGSPFLPLYSTLTRLF